MLKPMPKHAIVKLEETRETASGLILTQSTDLKEGLVYASQISGVDTDTKVYFRTYKPLKAGLVVLHESEIIAYE